MMLMFHCKLRGVGFLGWSRKAVRSVYLVLASSIFCAYEMTVRSS
jgi:hypothetical protein